MNEWYQWLGMNLVAERLVLTAVFFGAMGGLAKFAASLLPPRHKGGSWQVRDQDATWSTALILAGVDAFLGACGGITTLLVVAISGFLKGETDDSIKTVALLLAGGFAGKTLLEASASSLKAKVDRQNRELAKTEEGLGEQTRALQVETAICDATVLLSKEVPVQRRVLERISKLVTENPGDRRLAITLGRLHRHDGDVALAGGRLDNAQKSYQLAIAALDAFVSSVSNDASRRQDLADAMFNKACYLSLQAAALLGFTDRPKDEDAARGRFLTADDRTKAAVKELLVLGMAAVARAVKDGPAENTMLTTSDPDLYLLNALRPVIVEKRTDQSSVTSTATDQGDKR